VIVEIFACAVEASADYIVSGDEKHVLPVGTYQGIAVLRPRELLSMVERQQQAA
jgi:predicted nucleic acid-binding protein